MTFKEPWEKYGRGCNWWEYETLVELMEWEGVYLVNYFGVIWQLARCERRGLDDPLRKAQGDVVGLLFAGCLVILPRDVAIQNLDYLVPTRVPRTHCVVTKTGTVVHDLRKVEEYTQCLLDGRWGAVKLEQAARDMFEVVVKH